MIYIARIHNNYTEKFGIPRQSGLVGNSLSKIVFEPEFRNPDALRGLEGFSRIWLIWEFSEAVRRGKEAGITEWSPTVRPPRLGGNERMGVFATRSPFRPNPIGLSCVEIEEIRLKTDEGPVILVKGADLMNGTPIFDIKPYIPYADAFPDALGGFTDENVFEKAEVTFAPQAEGILTTQEEEELKEVLRQDPRPAYKRNIGKTYRFTFAGREVAFEACGGEIRVTEIQ
ncbi:MAG: tRNA (N6-threonylcarbamoyladenosine(37)-N6)-methyltransferase TrmO [Lachnospiraceae bacterium]|nr:tRNA (N6-threonylcarbamoyladenosine(37)-N6)-methyltransferase TrmO [Lachnospiraceae bacterium]